MILRIVDEETFGGPSLWFDRPIVRVVVASDTTDSVVGDCLQEFRMLVEHLDRQLDRTSLNPFPLPIPPDDATPVRMLAWAAVGLQCLAGDDISFFQVRDLDEPGRYEIVIGCGHHQTGLLALRIALQHLNAVLAGDRQISLQSLETAFTLRLVPVAASRRPRPETNCILAAARVRGIPIDTIDPRALIFELGTGKYRRRLSNTRTSESSIIGRTISRDKQLQWRYLVECGLPAPTTLIARDPESAIAHARQIGFPVVIKPNDEGNSMGVHLGLDDEEAVRIAFADAVQVSRSRTVVVQPHLRGRHYRIVVVNEKIVGISERIAAHIIGDGMHTIRELVELENRNPRRSTRKSDRLKPITVDRVTDRLLARQGFTLDDIPPTGVRLELQPIDDIERGGEAIARPGLIHPDNTRIVISAVRALEIDIAGVDLIAEDIGKSIWQTSGGILEVNSDTGFALIQFPTSGVDIDPGPAVIDMLFPPDTPVRIPLVAVTGGCDTTEISRLIGKLLTAAGYSTGSATRDGCYLDDIRLTAVDEQSTPSKRPVLLNPAVEIAVIELPPVEIVRQGLAFEYADVAVATSLSGASLAGLPTTESVVFGTIVPGGKLVIPADDTTLIRLAHDSGKELVLYGNTSEAGILANHRKTGGWTVFIDRATTRPEIVIDLGEGTSKRYSSPQLTDSSAKHWSAAIAAIVALGFSTETIRHAFES